MKQDIILEMAIMDVEQEVNGQKTITDAVAFRVVQPNDFDIEDGKVTMTVSKNAKADIIEFLNNLENYNGRILINATARERSRRRQRLHLKSVIKNLAFLDEMAVFEIVDGT